MGFKWEWGIILVWCLKQWMGTTGFDWIYWTLTDWDTADDTNIFFWLCCFRFCFLTCACFYSGFFSLHGRTGDILGFNFLSLFAFIYGILDLMCVWSCGGYGGALRWVWDSKCCHAKKEIVGNAAIFSSD